MKMNFHCLDSSTVITDISKLNIWISSNTIIIYLPGLTRFDHYNSSVEQKYISLAGLMKSSKLVTRNNAVVSIRFIPGSLNPVLPPGFSAPPTPYTRLWWPWSVFPSVFCWHSFFSTFDVNLKFFFIKNPSFKLGVTIGDNFFIAIVSLHVLSLCVVVICQWAVKDWGPVFTLNWQCSLPQCIIPTY